MNSYNDQLRLTEILSNESFVIFSMLFVSVVGSLSYKSSLSGDDSQ